MTPPDYSLRTRHFDTVTAPNGRAQSEAIGVTLLTGVVVIVALTIGALVITQTADEDSGPTTDILSDATTTDVVLAHNGGDSIPVDELFVRLEQDDATLEFSPTASDLSGPDARFDPGEQITRAHGFGSGNLEILVVHEPSNTVLLDDRATIPS
jgi:hypothetical protein